MALHFCNMFFTLHHLLGAVSSPLSCVPRRLGFDLEAPAHDLLQKQTENVTACGLECCGDPKCGGFLFEPESAVTYGGCQKSKPCCFMKTSVAVNRPMSPVPSGGSELWIIPGRSQDDETLHFLAAPLGSHMVLQRDSAKVVVWGFTTPGATVNTTLSGGPTHEVLFLSTRAAQDGTWRQRLPATAASMIAYTLSFVSSSGENASIVDVLFGDVYICGGQSNMEFAMPAVADAAAEKQEANDFPNIRFFSVGHRTQSLTPLRDLQTVWEPWQVASNLTINKDAYPGHTLFSTFSATCWLFGKNLAKSLSTTNNDTVPLGLISNNWGGTKIEVWTTEATLAACGRTGPDGPMFNAMIRPYTVGPMALSGFLWWQGEANTANKTTADEYACLFPLMIDAWRSAFETPQAVFLFVQLSTWCALPPESLPQMREAQMTALQKPYVGWVTDADHGMGCNIHPANKQVPGERLANAALGLRYGQPVQWRSPQYESATQIAVSTQGVVSVAIKVKGVSDQGLKLVQPYNYESPGYGPAATQTPTVVDCFGTFPTSPTTNESMLTQCAWAAVEVEGLGWINASVAVKAKSIILTTQGVLKCSPCRALSTANGWGPIPMLSVYDASTDLPVLPWNLSLYKTW